MSRRRAGADGRGGLWQRIHAADLVATFEIEKFKPQQCPLVVATVARMLF